MTVGSAIEHGHVQEYTAPRTALDQHPDQEATCLSTSILLLAATVPPQLPQDTSSSCGTAHIPCSFPSASRQPSQTFPSRAACARLLIPASVVAFTLALITLLSPYLQEANLQVHNHDTGIFQDHDLAADESLRPYQRLLSSKSKKYTSHKSYKSRKSHRKSSSRAHVSASIVTIQVNNPGAFGPASAQLHPDLKQVALDSQQIQLSQYMDPVTLPPPPALLNSLSPRELLCNYGMQPGTWLKVPARNDTVYAVNQAPMYDYTPDSGGWHMGGRWQTLNPRCRLRNLLRPHLDYNLPQAMPVNQTLKLVFLGDSIDYHVLVNVCEQRKRALAAANHTEPAVVQDSFSGPPQDPRTIVNYCLPGNGLALFQRYITSVDPTVPTPYMQRALEARAEMANQTGSADADLVLFKVNFWDLARLLWESNRTFTEVNLQHTLLPLWWLDQWMANFTSALQYTRQVFPKALIVYHTSITPVHDTAGLPPHQAQGWARKIFVAQMNAAGRAVADQLGVAVVDWEHMASAFTSHQAKIDLVHPVDWLNMEAFNVELNLLREYRAAEAASQRDTAPPDATAPAAAMQTAQINKPSPYAADRATVTGHTGAGDVADQLEAVAGAAAWGPGTEPPSDY